MSESTVGKTDNEITKQISIPLFECCLALGIARNTAENLAKRLDTNEFAPQLNQLTGLLATCGQRLAALTETLDAVFDSNREGLDTSRDERDHQGHQS